MTALLQRTEQGALPWYHRKKKYHPDDIPISRLVHIIAAGSSISPASQRRVWGVWASTSIRWATCGTAKHWSPRWGCQVLNWAWVMPTSQGSSLAQPTGDSSNRTSAPTRLTDST